MPVPKKDMNIIRDLSYPITPCFRIFFVQDIPTMRSLRSLWLFSSLPNANRPLLSERAVAEGQKAYYYDMNDERMNTSTNSATVSITPSVIR